MGKHLMLFILSCVNFAYATTILDDMPFGNHKFDYVKTLVDSSGRTFVFWLVRERVSELSEEYDQFIIKWAYRSKNGSFSSSSTIGTMIAPSPWNKGQDTTAKPFDVNMDSLGNIAVLFGQTESDSNSRLFSAYRKAGDNQSFSVSEVSGATSYTFAIKLKAAPNNTFFAILARGDAEGNDAYYYTQRLQGDNRLFSAPKVISSLGGDGRAGKVDIDFDFDSDSNVCLAWLKTGEDNLTVQSDVFYAFKPVIGDMQDSKKVERLNNKNYTTNIQVIYSGNTAGFEKTWALFWEETSSFTSDEGQNYIRAIMLENNGTNTNVSPAGDAKNLYEGQNDFLSKLTVFKLQSGVVLIFVEKGIISQAINGPLCHLYYNRYSLSGLIGNVQSKINLKKINNLNSLNSQFGYFLYSVAINLLNKDALIANETAWGTIPFDLAKFVYFGMLSSSIKDFTESQGVSVGYFLSETPIVSWYYNGRVDPDNAPAIVANSVGSKNNYKFPRNRAFFQRGVSAQALQF